MPSWFPRGEFTIPEKSAQKTLTRVESAFAEFEKRRLELPFAWGRVKKGEKPGFTLHAMRRNRTRFPWMVLHFMLEESGKEVRCTYRSRYSLISLSLLLVITVIFLAFPLQIAGTFVFGWHLTFLWWEYGLAAVSPLVWLWFIQTGRGDAERMVEEMQRRSRGKPTVET